MRQVPCRRKEERKNGIKKRGTMQVRQFESFTRFLVEHPGLPALLMGGTVVAVVRRRVESGRDIVALSGWGQLSRGEVAPHF